MWPQRGDCRPRDSADGGRRNGADRRQVLARFQIRRAGRAVRGRDRQGLFQGRRPRCDDRHRGRFARTDQPRRLRHLRHGLRRHQFADQVPRRQSRHAAQGGVHGLQQAAVRRRRPQEPRRHEAEGSRRQEARRARRRRRVRAMEDFRAGQRHRCLESDHRERRLPGARADAGRRPGRRHHRIFVLLLHQSERPRRAGRRHRRAADGGLWRQPLRQQHHRQSEIRRGKTGSREGASCARSSRASRKR